MVRSIYGQDHPIPDGAKQIDLRRYAPQFSQAERNRRWDRLRKHMRLWRLDAVLIIGTDGSHGMAAANARYMTQVAAGSMRVLFFLDEDPIVWSGGIHTVRPTPHYLSTQDWVKDIRAGGGAPAIAAELRNRKLAKSRVGLVGFSTAINTTPMIYHGEIVALEKELPEVEFVAAHALFEHMRMIKSEEEIGMLAKAGQISRKVVDTFIEAPKPGMTEAEFLGEVYKTMLSEGAELQPFFFLVSGPAQPPASEFWHLLHGVPPTVMPNTRPFERGDIISAEWHVQYGGYLAATEFAVYLGRKAPDKLLDINKVAVECLRVSMEVMKPGNTLRQAWEAIRKPADDAGLDYVELGFHGHGMASPEFPTVVYPEGYGPPSMNGAGIGELVFEEGMVFGNNIDLSNTGWRSDVGLHFGDMLVIRGNRAEPLVNIPHELPQIGWQT